MESNQFGKDKDRVMSGSAHRRVSLANSKRAFPSPFPIRHLLDALWLTGLVLALLGALVAYRSLHQLHQNELWVRHTHEVLDGLQATLVSMKDADAGQHGYLITAGDDYLAAFEEGTSNASRHLARVNQLVRDNPLQMQRAERLSQLMQQRFEQLRHSIELRRKFGEEAARAFARTVADKPATDELRTLVDEMVSEENDLLRGREAESETSRTRVSVVVGFISLLVVVLLFTTRLLVIRDLTRRRAAEEALRRSEALLARAQRVAKLGSWEWDLRSGELLWSEETYRILGVAPDEFRVSYKAFLSAIHPDDREQVKLAVEHGLAGQPFSAEYRVTRADGSVRNVLAQGGVDIDRTGRPVRIVGTALDITDRKRVEEALRQSEQRLRFHVENTPLAVIEWDAGFRLSHWSTEAERLFGWRAEEVLGKRLDEFRWVHQEDVQKVAQVAAGLVDGSRPCSVSHNRNYRKDGSVVYCEWYNSALLDGAGKLVSVLSLVLDVTERKRAEQEAFETHQRLDALMRALPVGVSFSDDATCQRITGNPAALAQFEVTAEENLSASAPDENAPGRQVQFFDKGRLISASELPLQRAVAENREIPAMELEVELPSGRRWFAECSGAPIRDQEGKVVGGVAVTVDITERKQAEEALIRSEKLASVGRMAATIAHEINNPLAAVMNSLYLAQTAPALPDSARRFLNLADEEVRRVSYIARQSLGFYHESVVPTTTEVGALLESVIELLKGRTNVMGMTVVKESKPDLQITAVAGELRQVLANFLANSVDAVGENGTIKLRASGVSYLGERHAIRVTIADNGKGMDAASLSHLFEPFFTTKNTGTGLGLWVSKQIIDKHGGSIRVRSRTSGSRRGTTVSVFLPAGRDDRTCGSGPAGDSAKNGRPMCIGITTAVISARQNP